MICECEMCTPKPKASCYESDCCIDSNGEIHHHSDCNMRRQNTPLPAEVEEKIKMVIHEFKWSGTAISRKYDALRELAHLARKAR